MSDIRRKNARLQGKFSDPKEFSSGRHKRKEKKNTQDHKSPENNDECMKSQVSKSRTAAEGISVEYQEKSSYSFKELVDEKPIQEIREKGVHEISKTENGSSRIIYEPNFMSQDRAEELMIILRDCTKWHRKNIIIRGQEYPQPRLVAWYGPFPYEYSGACLDKAEMPGFIVDIKNEIETFLKEKNVNVSYNSVLLNYYRNGNDSVSWHSDDELTMGVHPTIASVSLGEIRAFQMRPKPHVKELDPETKLEVNLVPGSLLIMDGCMQKDWQHQVPKEYHDKGARINLTFRNVSSIDNLPTEVPCLVNESEESIYNWKCPQPKPVYDSENFPPLVPESSKRIAQNSLHQTDVSVSKKVTSEKKSVLDPNKEINSSLSSKSLDSLSNIIETKPDTKENLSTEESLFNEQISDTCFENEAKDISNESVKESIFHEEEVLDLKMSSHVNNEEIKAECTSVNKHTLNVNAPDFIPGTPFSDPVPQSDCSCQAPGESPIEYGYTLIEKLKDMPRYSRDYSVARDWLELDVYIKLTEGGQSRENQRVINDRVCLLMDNVKPRRNMPRNRGRSNTRGCSNRFYRGR